MQDEAARAIKVLSENGCHFLRSTLDEIQRDDQTGNRNAVIFVAAALEVLLKTRLAMEHWTLLFDDSARAKLSELKTGEFVSAQASKLVGRLNNVASLGLDGDAPEKIFRLRNRLVHYAPPSNLAVRVEVAIGLSFALDFIHDHLLPKLLSGESEHKELASLKEEISRVFLELDELRTKRLLLLRGELKAHGTIIECPDCSQQTLVVKGDDEGNSCLFCLVKSNGEELAQQYVSGVLHWSWRDEADGGEDPIHRCFNCDVLALVAGARVVNRPRITHLCLSCAETFEAEDVGRCDRCGSLKAQGEDSMCSDCWSALVPGWH